MAGSGFDADTRDALMGVRSDTRDSYYGNSRTRTVFIIWAVALCLAVMIVGLGVDKPLGHAIVLLGVGGLALIAFWSSRDF